MKRVLSLMLALVMMMSFSVVAFAADTVASEEDKLLETVPMPKDVSIVDDKDGKVQIAGLLDAPDSTKAAAKEQIEGLEKMGYKIHSGFIVWSDDKDVTMCSIELPELSVPNNAVVFLNAQRIQTETKDSVKYFDVSLNGVVVVLIAVREDKAPDFDGYTPVSGGGSDLHYSSPTV